MFLLLCNNYFCTQLSGPCQQDPITTSPFHRPASQGHNIYNTNAKTRAINNLLLRIKHHISFTGDVVGTASLGMWWGQLHWGCGGDSFTGDVVGTASLGMWWGQLHWGCGGDSFTGDVVGTASLGMWWGQLHWGCGGDSFTGDSFTGDVMETASLPADILASNWLCCLQPHCNFSILSVVG